MNKSNFRTQLVKAAGFLSVASLSVLISLPGHAQQSPDNASPTVPSTVKPTNPGGRDAGTTNGGEDLNRVPNSGSTMQQNNSTKQPAGVGADNADPTSRPDAVNRVEGRDQGTQNRTNTSPSGTSSKPGANQPGATTGGDSSQQVERQNGGSTMQNGDSTMQNGDSTMQNGGSTMQNGGSTMQQDQTTPGTMQSSPRQRPQSGSNSGSSTGGASTTQQQPSNGSVRALW